MTSAPTPGSSRLQTFTLGDWRVDSRACQLSRGEECIKLRPQLVDVLICLARRAGQIVLKDEILEEVWPGQFIADSGLSRCIAELRGILQDDAQAPRFIETIPKRGYRMTAPVVWLPTPTGHGASASAALVPAEAAVDAGRAIEESAAVPAAVASLPEPDGAAPAPVASDADRRPLEARPAAARRWRWVMVATLAVAVAVTVWLASGRPSQVLTDRDPVLLAFENHTGDAVFDEVIPLAMSVQLEQSPHLALLSPGRIAEVLQMMKRPPNTAITRAIGLEVCERAGARAVIVTSIASLGRQYAIGLEAVACGTGEVLARRQVTPDGKEHVLAGLQRVAGDIRAAVGEPAASLARYNVPIVEATTASLEALRALRQGDLARDRGESGAALGFYRQAVAIDPDFALAHSRRGRTAQQAGTETEAREAFERAFALRQRVTLLERLDIEVHYQRFVAGDLAKTGAALTLLRENYPRRAWVHWFLYFEHLEQGRLQAAHAEALEAQRLEPESPRVLAAVARSFLCLNRAREARTVAERGLVLAAGSHAALHLILFECAIAADDAASIARERAWAGEHPDAAEPHASEVEADVALGKGRLRHALALLAQREAWANAHEQQTDAGASRLWMAYFEALVGRREQASWRLHEELRRGVLPSLKYEALKVAAFTDDLELTARLLDEIERERAPGVQPDTTFVRTFRAMLAARGGRLTDAMDLLRPLEPSELGFLYEYLPLFERARINALAGRWDAARDAFAKMLENPTVGTVRKLLPLAEIGRAQALARAGDVAGSRAAYERFFERWREADPDLPLLLDARREYAALPK